VRSSGRTTQQELTCRHPRGIVKDHKVASKAVGYADTPDLGTLWCAYTRVLRIGNLDVPDARFLDWYREPPAKYVKHRFFGTMHGIWP
jgi:hypothetical protein